jgi:hypothetical protein
MSVIRDPLHRPLTEQETKAAVKDLVVEYPQVLRGDRDKAVVQQTYGIVSFLLLKEPSKTSNGKRCHGFIKLRGNHGDKNLCVNEAARIVREQDSKNKNRIVEVGVWYPITDDDGTAEMVDVREDVSQEEDRKRREAIRQREEESARIIKEIKEREEEIKNSKDLNDDKDSLDYYTMKYVTWLELKSNVDRFRAKMDDLEKKWKETRKILAEMDGSHPEFNKVWIDHYNQERRKTKLPDFIPSTEQDELYAKKILPE